MQAPMSAAQFIELGRLTAKYKYSNSAAVSLRRFKSNFGVPADVVACVWELLIESPLLLNHLPGLLVPDPVHLLWALMLLKRYDTMDVLAAALKIDEDTLRKWSHFYLEAIAELDSEVVRTCGIHHGVTFCVFGVCFLFLVWHHKQPHFQPPSA